jgi:riboflavin synthase
MRRENHVRKVTLEWPSSSINASLFAEPLFTLAAGRAKDRPASLTNMATFAMPPFDAIFSFMFTGLIEEVGSVLALLAGKGGPKLQIVAPRITKEIHLGDSVAVNGCCLTVAARSEDQLTFDLLEETLSRTNLEALHRDSPVNLERALAADARLGGHFVQGHVDCSARILASEESGADQRLELELPAEFAHYVASKGSIAVNGVSLTVAELRPESFVVWVIPHTRAQTNLGAARPGELVNLEFDLIAKYLERMLDRNAVRSE